MKAFISKISILLMLTLAITGTILKAADDLNLSREQQTGLFLIQKLYGPLKKQLTDLNDQVTSLKSSLAWIEKLSKEELTAQSAKIKKALGKKINKIEKTVQNLTIIKQALNRCPLSLKTDRAQQAIALAGTKYLGDINPAVIEKKINDLQIIIDDILSLLK